MALERFGTILVDCPWDLRTWDRRRREKEGVNPYPTPYQCLSLDWLCGLPVKNVAAKNCALYMWVTSAHMPACIQVARAWGFRWSSKAWTWIKQSEAGALQIGRGYTTRKATEDCLLFKRGNPRRLSLGVTDVMVAPRREHSRKPDETWDRCEALYPGPYLEIFARYPREGWTQIGNEMTGRDIFEDLQLLVSQGSLPMPGGVPVVEDSCALRLR